MAVLVLGQAVQHTNTHCQFWLIQPLVSSFPCFLSRPSCPLAPDQMFYNCVRVCVCMHARMLCCVKGWTWTRWTGICFSLSVLNFSSFATQLSLPVRYTYTKHVSASTLFVSSLIRTVSDLASWVNSTVTRPSDWTVYPKAGLTVAVRGNDSLRWRDDVRIHLPQPGRVYALLGSAAFGRIQLQHVIHQV